MVACYCRVSSRRQTHESQKAEIQRWLRQNRIRARRVVWFEDTETGRSLKRPAFERLQHVIFAGKVMEDEIFVGQMHAVFLTDLV